MFKKFYNKIKVILIRFFFEFLPKKWTIKDDLKPLFCISITLLKGCCCVTLQYPGIYLFKANEIMTTLTLKLTVKFYFHQFGLLTFSFTHKRHSWCRTKKLLEGKICIFLKNFFPKSKIQKGCFEDFFSRKVSVTFAARMIFFSFPFFSFFFSKKIQFWQGLTTASIDF